MLSHYVCLMACYVKLCQFQKGSLHHFYAFAESY
ncbi:MAG: hypothetical protein A4E57_04391 [Syntrophorhabdaceae bacterium PtaU1.Bin034]|nr:MAG: hypothetical protein A4E57_04391 [Syntrophorhabdaceae bacterium PtaU1.Bin034]